MDTQTSEELFYLIGPDNSRLVPYIAHARDGRSGYQLTPRRYQNSVSHARFTTDLKDLVQSVVMKDRAVRVIKRLRGGGAQRNAIMLGEKSAPRYWLCPSVHDWVAGASIRPSSPVR